MDMRSILSVINELEEDVNLNGDNSGEPEHLNEYETSPLFKREPTVKSRNIKQPPRHNREYQRTLPQMRSLPKTNPTVASTATDFDDKKFQSFMRKFAKASQYARGHEMLRLMADLVASSDEKEEVENYLSLPFDIGGGRWQHIHLALYDKFYPRVKDLYAKYAARYKAKHPKSNIPAELPRYFDNVKKPWAYENYIQEYENILNEIIISATPR